MHERSKSLEERFLLMEERDNIINFSVIGASLFRRRLYQESPSIVHVLGLIEDIIHSFSDFRQGILYSFSDF